MKQMQLTGSVRKYLAVGSQQEMKWLVCLYDGAADTLIFKVSGTAEVSFELADLDTQLQRQTNQSLSQIQQAGLRIFLGVFVTNVKSKVLV